MYDRLGNLERKLHAIESAIEKRIDQQDNRVQAELDDCFDGFRRKISNHMDDKQHMLDSALHSVKKALNDQFHVLHAKLMQQQVSTISLTLLSGISKRCPNGSKPERIVSKNPSTPST